MKMQFPQVRPYTPPIFPHPLPVIALGEPSPSLFKRNIYKKKNHFPRCRLASGYRLARLQSSRKRGKREREKDGCESQAASLLTLPVSLSPSVKAEEERIGRRSRRAAAWAWKAAHSDR